MAVSKEAKGRMIGQDDGPKVGTVENSTGGWQYVIFAQEAREGIYKLVDALVKGAL